MMTGFFEIAPAAEGLVRRTPWWQSIASRIAWDALSAAVLTTVNAIFIGALGVGALRSRRKNAS